MHFNPELIRSYSPDDETYKRAEKIADLHKWLVAASSANLIWGEISGSASEAYSTMICIEPLLMSCNCPVKSITCNGRTHTGTSIYPDGWGFDITSDLITIEHYRFTENDELYDDTNHS
jgi:hypothetical protein